MKEFQWYFGWLCFDRSRQKWLLPKSSPRMKMVFGVRYLNFLHANQSSNETSFSVTVGFFDDMYIPTAYLPQPSALYVSYIAFHFPPLLITISATQMSAAISGSQNPPLPQVLSC